MKLKNLTLIFASILAVFLLAGLSSATDCILVDEVSIPNNVTHDTGKIDFSINVSFDNSCSKTRNNTNITYSANKEGDFSDDEDLFNLSKNDSKVINAQFDLEPYQSGDVIITVIQNSDEGEDDPQILSDIKILDSSELSLSGSDFKGENKTTITIENKGNKKLENINLSKSSGDLDVNFSEKTISELEVEDSKEIEVTMLDNVDDLDFGKSTTTIKAEDEDGTKDTTKISYDKSYSWDTENIDNQLDIDDFELILEKGFGDEDEKRFYPLDTITAEFTLENGRWRDADYDVDVDDIEIEACLYDTKEKECVMDEEDMELSDNDFYLSDNDEIDLTANFKINPEELNERSTNYDFFIRLEGKTYSVDEAYDRNKTAVSDSKEGLRIYQKEFVVVDDLRVSSPLEEDSYECGSEIKVEGDIWNIGNSDLDKENVYLEIYNKELGINEVIDVEELSALEYLPFDLTFDIPEELDEKSYKIDFAVYDDEHLSDSDVYKLYNEDDDEAIYSLLMDVSGKCSIPEAEISDTFLEEGEYAGETFVVKTKITNTGEETTEYNIAASDYSEWASSVQISDQVFSLDSGDSKQIQLELKTREDVSGEKTFDLEIYSENDKLTQQPVQVSVKEKESFAGIDWNNIDLVKILLVAISIVLLVIIIVLFSRLSKKDKTK